MKKKKKEWASLDWPPECFQSIGEISLCLLKSDFLKNLVFHHLNPKMLFAQFLYHVRQLHRS